ncbi:MAG: N-acetylmuramoyl-L-alanine amidase [Peptococcaceae bacterium]|jgi:hypothetical protein|nr:N-acetylmuramoyl-L-alanine amidase [Peptococcaceae bacterium]MDH7524881.1 N-acetylmuramoyl-L-alanine amidase [Peptococcaceae bacterium]
MRAEKPEIKWIGSPFFGSPRGTKGRNGHKVIAVVDHIMDGTLQGTDAWFNNEKSGGASAHFGVGKNGEIHQYVSLGDVAWHAGNVDEPSWALLKPDINPNWYTIGIEHEGHPGDVMPEPQFQATLALHKWLVEIFNLEVNRDTIIGHYRIDSVSRANCPGPNFPWDRLFLELSKPAGPFSDVPPDHWAAQSVERVYEAGIMNGYPDGTFKGDQTVTRYEQASALDRMLTLLNKKAGV